MTNTHMHHVTSEGLEVEYTYWEDKGDYLQPPESGIDINKLTYNGVDLTDLLFEVAQVYTHEILQDKLEQINE